MTLELPGTQRFHEVVGAGAVAGDAEVVLVAPRITRGDEHVVAAGVVESDLELRRPAVGPETIGLRREQTTEGNQRVQRAKRGVDVAGIVWNTVRILLAL